jgi:hypothetical protein
MDTLPSLEAHANNAPKSGEAQAMLLTEEVWRVCSNSFDQDDVCGDVDESRQIITLASYEADARIVPNLGCAHATCHTGPVCLKVSKPDWAGGKTLVKCPEVAVIHRPLQIP